MKLFTRKCSLKNVLISLKSGQCLRGSGGHPPQGQVLQTHWVGLLNEDGNVSSIVCSSESQAVCPVKARGVSLLILCI